MSLGALIESNLRHSNAENRTAKAKSTNTIHALFTLRNLSDEAARQPSNDNFNVLAVLIQLVERNDLVKRNLACEILYNLICRNYQNKGMSSENCSTTANLCFYSDCYQSIEWN